MRVTVLNASSKPLVLGEDFSSDGYKFVSVEAGDNEYIGDYVGGGNRLDSSSGTLAPGQSKTFEYFQALDPEKDGKLIRLVLTRSWTPPSRSEFENDIAWDSSIPGVNYRTAARCHEPRRTRVRERSCRCNSAPVDRAVPEGAHLPPLPWPQAPAAPRSVGPQRVEPLLLTLVAADTACKAWSMSGGSTCVFPVPHMPHDVPHARWAVERAFAWLHQLKRLRIRYERRTGLHDACSELACSLMCLRRPEGHSERSIGCASRNRPQGSEWSLPLGAELR